MALFAVELELAGDTADVDEVLVLLLLAMATFWQLGHPFEDFDSRHAFLISISVVLTQPG